VEATPNRLQLVGNVAVVQRWTILKVKGIAERREHPMAQAAFGIFDWIDRGNTPLQQLCEERLQLLGAAKSIGYNQLIFHFKPKEHPRQ
jgi:hypothetical protein